MESVSFTVSSKISSRFLLFAILKPAASSEAPTLSLDVNNLLANFSRIVLSFPSGNALNFR